MHISLRLLNRSKLLKAAKIMGLLETPAIASPVHDAERNFLYFAFGSNLYAERLQLSCPSATRLFPARLHGFKLAFNYNSLRWRGHVATIKEDENASLWGCVWTIPKVELEALDKQEGVDIGLYRPLHVEVTSEEGHSICVRTYQMALPYEEDTKPSVVYKRVMIVGAMDSSLPKDYIDFMKAIPDNGYDGPVDVHCQLTYRQDAAVPHSHLSLKSIEAAMAEEDMERADAIFEGLSLRN